MQSTAEEMARGEWTKEDQDAYDKWVKQQNAAAREQGYANMDHALEATDYKRRRFGWK